MKKILLFGALALMATKAHASLLDQEVIATKATEVAQYAAIGVGSTLAIWGIISLEPHFKVVGRGYDYMAEKIKAIGKRFPWIKTTAEYSAPIVALPIAYNLVQCGRGKA